TIAASVVLLAVPAFAQAPNPAVEEIAKKVQAQTYLPKESGLKDISLTINNSMMAMMGGDIAIHYWWKAPDKEKLTVSGLEDNPMVPPQALDSMKKQLVRVGRMCVGDGLVDQLKGYDCTVGKDGDLTTISAKTSDPEKFSSEVTYW